MTSAGLILMCRMVLRSLCFGGCQQPLCARLPQRCPTCQSLLPLAPHPVVLPAGVKLETLDLRGNPGLTPAVEAALEASPLLARAEFFNGHRLRR